MAYFGGKGQDGVYHTIINQMPPHIRYVEPFLGGGSIMLKKRPAVQSIGLDLDEKAVFDFSEHPLTGLELHILDAFEFLRYRTGKFGIETLIFCDPPYLHSTRSCDTSRYKFELTDEEHYSLLQIIKSLKCRVMITTYPNKLYSSELEDWRTVTYNSVKRSGKVSKEIIFMNYPQPEILHDDRYIGENSGQRQDIKRRIIRTNSRLLNWPTNQRLKLLKMLLENMPKEEIDYLFQIPGFNNLPGTEGKNTCRIPKGNFTCPADNN